MKKIIISALLLAFFTVTTSATPVLFPEHDGKDGMKRLLSGVTEEQFLGANQGNILEGLIKTIDDIDEYEEKIKIIEEDEGPEQIQEPVPPVLPAVEEPAAVEESAAVKEPAAETKEETEKVTVKAEPEVHVHTRNILARTGDSIEISLKGRGWIYVGEQQGRVGIEFRGRNSGFEETAFSLYAADLGEYVLQFQLQDLSAGNIYIEEINTRVLSDEDFEQELTGAKEGVALTPSGSGDYSSARRMVNNGRLNDGLEEFLRQYKEGEPAINQEIAALAYNVKRLDLARRYWGKNLDEESAYRDEALAGIVKTAVAQGNQKDYDAFIVDFMKIRHPEKGEILITASQFQEELGNIQEAVNLLQESLHIEPYGLYADQACFRLGKIYESQSTLRDIQKAVDFYTRVKDDFPGSIYWDESRSRIDYLNRHFLLIR